MASNNHTGPMGVGVLGHPQVLGTWPPMDVHHTMSAVESDQLYIHAERFIKNLMGQSSEREVKVDVENWSGGFSLVCVHILNTKTREIVSLREPLNLFPSTAFLAKLELLK